MKQCEKCGAIQGDNRTVCVDCGAFLGEPLSAREEERANAEISETVAELTSESGEFRVSAADRILGVLSILFIAVLAAMTVYASSQSQKAESLHPDSGSDIIFGVSETDQEIMRYGEIGQTALFGIVFFSLAAAFALLPKVVYTLDSFKYRIWFEGSPAPSAIYLVFFRFTKYGCFALGCGLLLTAALRFI